MNGTKEQFRTPLTNPFDQRDGNNGDTPPPIDESRMDLGSALWSSTELQKDCSSRVINLLSSVLSVQPSTVSCLNRPPVTNIIGLTCRFRRWDRSYILIVDV
jgi:hypothetical protein